jgi:2-dehydro-3-deoxygalactonokinase
VSQYSGFSGQTEEGNTLIAIDWGSSNFRAFRIDGSGTIFDRKSFAGGILRIQDGRFAEALVEQVGEWLQDGEDRILLSGMVGSRQGWLETEYLSCPVGLADLANAVVKVPYTGAEVMLIPGVTGTDADGVPEVMRGEETEAMGVLDAYGGTGLVCLPGTHTKWINIHDHAIISFVTCITGDVFAALRDCTILSRIMNKRSDIDMAAFLRGVARSADSGGLLHHLFSVRTLALTNQLSEDSSASYLSGLLIGHEVRSVMPAGPDVHLVGSSQLCLLYAQAVEACGGTYKIENGDAAARGLAAVARRLKWI